MIVVGRMNWFDATYKANLSQIHQKCFSSLEPLTDQPRMTDGGGQSAGRSGAHWKPKGSYNGEEAEDSTAVYAQRFADVDRINDLDAQMGFGAFNSGPPRMGWMINMSAVLLVFNDEWLIWIRLMSKMPSGPRVGLLLTTIFSRRMAVISRPVWCTHPTFSSNARYCLLRLLK